MLAAVQLLVAVVEKVVKWNQTTTWVSTRAMVMSRRRHPQRGTAPLCVAQLLVLIVIPKRESSTHERRPGLRRKYRVA